MIRRAIGVVVLGAAVLFHAAPASAGDHHKKKKKPKPEEKAPPEPDPVPVPDPAPPPPPPPEPEAPAGPWADGVTDDQKAAAQVLLEAGNAFFFEAKWSDALGKYRDAVAQWDHPAIRFNMVRCLIQLEKPVEAYDNLTLALKYGAAPLEESVYNEALAYQKLLLGQIAEVEVSCKESGTKVTLDGQPLIPACPGVEKRRLVPGNHQVVGTKDGYMTLTKDVVLLPGKEEAVVVQLVKLEDAAVLTRRWPTWKPWAVVGGGLVVGGLGGLLQLAAISKMDDYNTEIENTCSRGCTTINDGTASLESTALLYNKVAIGMMVTGAATVVTGAILVFMNRAQTTYPDESATQVAITPRPEGGATVDVGLHF